MTKVKSLPKIGQKIIIRINDDPYLVRNCNRNYNKTIGTVLWISQGRKLIKIKIEKCPNQTEYVGNTIQFYVEMTNWLFNIIDFKWNKENNEI